ncbi:hypothetical protein BT96DRAFT_946820 [Gymnopus androsaceus JB14]|uniref:Uncharacterized protein n=1 Tax=Gymnopus androsaceus JB14 TaxID=1447944 RepID=A0A6A4GUH7_9AGAR|nr:hypothetical protein BT96DRAFT_946820 [Gymnopus androsaceus JB14]
MTLVKAADETFLQEYRLKGLQDDTLLDKDEIKELKGLKFFLFIFHIRHQTKDILTIVQTLPTNVHVDVLENPNSLTALVESDIALLELYKLALDKATNFENDFCKAEGKIGSLEKDLQGSCNDIYLGKSLRQKQGPLTQWSHRLREELEQNNNTGHSFQWCTDFNHDYSPDVEGDALSGQRTLPHHAWSVFFWGLGPISHGNVTKVCSAEKWSRFPVLSRAEAKHQKAGVVGDALCWKYRREQETMSLNNEGMMQGDTAKTNIN